MTMKTIIYGCRFRCSGNAFLHILCATMQKGSISIFDSNLTLQIEKNELIETFNVYRLSDHSSSLLQDPMLCHYDKVFFGLGMLLLNFTIL